MREVGGQKAARSIYEAIFKAKELELEHPGRL
jgi:hypothetical protein